MVQVPIEVAGGSEAAQSRHSGASLEKRRQVHNAEEKQTGTKETIISRAVTEDESCKEKMSASAEKKESKAENR